MKKLHFIFSIITLSLVSCNNINTNDTPDYTVVVIDSCEYIEYKYGFVDNRVHTITHKGNCKFCKERSNK